MTCGSAAQSVASMTPLVRCLVSPSSTCALLLATWCMLLVSSLYAIFMLWLHGRLVALLTVEG